MAVNISIITSISKDSAECADTSSVAINAQKYELPRYTNRRIVKSVTVLWEHEDCTDRTASAFARLTRNVRSSEAKRVVLDMSKCRFLSVGGLRHIMEWQTDLAKQGIIARVTGLSPMLESVFKLAKLDWILV